MRKDNELLKEALKQDLPDWIWACIIALCLVAVGGELK